MKKILTLLLVLSMLIPCLASCGGKKQNLEKQYNEAIELIGNKDYESAYKIFLTLGDYKDAAKYLSSFYFLPTRKVVKDFGGEYVTELAFDDSGRPYKILEYDDYSVLEFVYDSKSNVVESVERGIVGEYTYDQNGNLVTEKYSDSDNIELYKYVYNETGMVVEETVESSNPDGSDFSIEVIKYTYDSNGELIKKESNSGGDNKVVTQYDTTYDDSGRPVCKTYKQETNGKTTDESLTEYTYDADGRLVRESVEETEHISPDYLSLRVINTVTDYVYDDNDNLLSKTSISEYQGKKTNEIKIEYTYDEAGKLIKENKRDECYGGTFVEMGLEFVLSSWLNIDETYYGENGNITRRTRYRDHDGVTTEQRFDDYGNMVYQKNDHEASESMRYEIEITYVLAYLPDIKDDVIVIVEEEMLRYTWRIEE